jgi:hypothetical protein
VTFVYSVLSVRSLYNEDVLAYITGHPVPRKYKYGDLARQVRGVSNLRQQNMLTSPAGLGPKNDCAGRNCKTQTRSLVRESDPHKKKPQLSDSRPNKNLVVSPRRMLDTKTDWLTVRRSEHNFDFD